MADLNDSVDGIGRTVSPRAGHVSTHNFCTRTQAEQRLRTGYNRLAPVWDVLTTAFLNVTNRSQASGLALLPPGQRVLIVGGGTGHFLRSLIKQARPQSVDYVDISPHMLKRTRAKIKPHQTLSARVRLIAGTVDNLPLEPADYYDVICLNFYWDQFSIKTIAREFEHLQKLCAPASVWYITDFTPNRGALVGLFVKALYSLFKFFGVANQALPDIFSFMAQRSEKIFERSFWPGIVHCQFRIHK